jgi:hypothetical protein
MSLVPVSKAFAAKSIRRMSIAVLFCFTLSFFSGTSAQAADKSYTKCTKLGEKISIRGDSFTCYRVGNQRIWAPTFPPNFGEKYGVKLGGPCIAANENKLYWEGRAKVVCKRVKGKFIYEIKTWPPASSATKFVNRLFESLRPKIAASESPAEKNFLIEPGYESKLWFQDSIEAVDVAFKLSEALNAKISNPPQYVLFWNLPWATPYVPAQCLKWVENGIGMGAVCYTNQVYAALGNAVTNRSFEINEPDKYQDEEQRYWIIAGMQHEVGHLGQLWTHARAKSQSDISRIDDKKPAWLREGVAEVFKIMSYAFQFNIEYQDARNLHVRNMGNRCTPTSLEKLMQQGTTDSGCEYNNGTLAVELLLSKTRSLESLFAWERSVSMSDETGSLRDIQDQMFKRAFGLDLASFMKEADAYITRESS